MSKNVGAMLGWLAQKKEQKAWRNGNWAKMMNDDDEMRSSRQKRYRGL